MTTKQRLAAIEKRLPPGPLDRLMALFRAGNLRQVDGGFVGDGQPTHNRIAELLTIARIRAARSRRDQLPDSKGKK